MLILTLSLYGENRHLSARVPPSQVQFVTFNSSEVSNRRRLNHSAASPALPKNTQIKMLLKIHKRC